jgi:hypothetical protein
MKFAAIRRASSRASASAGVSSSSLVPAVSTASRRALLIGLAASAVPVQELANALCGLAPSAEPDWRDAELLSLYAAVLKQSDIYERAERAHDRYSMLL